MVGQAAEVAAAVAGRAAVVVVGTVDHKEAGRAATAPVSSSGVVVSLVGTEVQLVDNGDHMPAGHSKVISNQHSSPAGDRYGVRKLF